MNNIKEQDELFSSVEPPVSYYSSSENCGVTAIFSNKEIKSFRKMNSLFTPVSPKNNFSLCNTIMWPFIINEKTIELDNNKNINKSATLIKEKELNHISNTRNKTISSKSENKEYSDLLNGKIIVKHDNTNLERNPYFMGKNLSTNFLIDKKSKDEEFNLRYHNANYESDNNNSKIEGDFKDYMNREQCKSVNINNVYIKNNIIKDDNKKEKSTLFIKKGKKAKIKDSFNPEKKYNKKDKDTVNKIEKKKSFFCRGQSRSFIEELKKEDIQKPDKIKVGMNNLKKGKNFYYSNKMINKNYNENYFKIIIKKNNYDKIEEEEEKENKNKLRTERKKKKKCDFKNSLKNNSIKGLKIKFNEKNLKQEYSHFKQGLNILKEHIKNKDQNDNSSHDDSINDKDDIKKAKTKRIRRRTKEKEKNIKDSDSEEKNKIKTATPNRRISGYTFNKKYRRRNSDNENSQSKTVKILKAKNSKDINSKSHSSLKENNTKKSLANSLSKKEIDDLKNSYDEKENLNKVTAVLRRKRSISMHLEKSKIKEVTEAIKIKKPKNETNLYSLSTNKIKKYTQKKFDFETALKKNLKKMQFNLFSKDKFTNTEFSDSDYLKYTLNCMELILDIDIEKQVRLKNKINFNFPKPKKKGVKKRIALFDLDETLVHCTGDIKVKKDKYQHAIEINLPGKQAVKVGINLRPYWKQTLNLIKKNYYIVIYTASHQAYADAVLDFMDPKKKYFKYRLYRNNCSLIDVEGAKFYVKDLDIFNEHYDLKDIVIIDNSVLSFAYHLHNGIPIVPYYDEDKDGSLYVVGLYLIHIFGENDLREANKTQINLDSFLEEAKKQREENENIIDEESDEEEEEKSKNMEPKEKEKQNGEVEKNNAEYKKTSGKNAAFNRKSSFINNALLNPRRQSHDFTQKKLISQSKLINMYYEVNDESSKNIQNSINESIEENKDNENLYNNVNTTNTLSQEKNQQDQAKIIVTENGEIDCKSDPGILNLANFNNNNISDNDSSDEEIAFLKRGYTIIEEKRNNNNIIKGKLKFIRSNFFNKFKIK